MKVYVLLHEDRHIDSQVYVFDSATKAVNQGNAIAAEQGKKIAREIIPGYLMYLTYGDEGDSIKVIEKNVV